VEGRSAIFSTGSVNPSPLTFTLTRWVSGGMMRWGGKTMRMLKAPVGVRFTPPPQPANIAMPTRLTINHRPIAIITPVFDGG
jgi:hypothetical protein